MTVKEKVSRAISKIYDFEYTDMINDAIDSTGQLETEHLELKAAYIAYRKAMDNAEKWDLDEVFKRRDHMDELCGYKREV